MSTALNVGRWGAIVLALTIAACGRFGDPEASSSTRIPPLGTVPTAPAPTANAPSGVTPDAPPPPNPQTSAEQPVSTAEAATSLSRPDPLPPPDVQRLPTRSGPGNLASVTLPDDFAAITTLVEHLPSGVAGHARTTQLDRVTPAGTRVGYGEERRLGFGGNPLLVVQAVNIALSDFWPTSWTAGQAVAAMARHGEEVKDIGRDGKLVWMRQDTFMGTADAEARFPVYTMAWGLIDSSWMFTAQADSEENRDALLAAFVAAAKTALTVSSPGEIPTAIPLQSLATTHTTPPLRGSPTGGPTGPPAGWQSVTWEGLIVAVPPTYRSTVEHLQGQRVFTAGAPLRSRLTLIPPGPPRQAPARMLLEVGPWTDSLNAFLNTVRQAGSERPVIDEATLQRVHVLGYPGAMYARDRTEPYRNYVILRPGIVLLISLDLSDGAQVQVVDTLMDATAGTTDGTGVPIALSTAGPR